MLRHIWLLALGMLLLIGGLAAVALYITSRPSTLNFAVPGGNAEDVHLVQAIAQQFSRERAGIRLKLTTVKGPAQSAATIDEGTSDLAIVRADLPLPKHGLAVAVLRQNVAVFIVPAPGSEAKAKSDKDAIKGKGAKPKRIEKIEDLPGHRIGVVGRGGTNNSELLNVILRQYEIAPEKVTIVPVDVDNIRAALRKDPVDLIFVVGPVTSHAITEAIAAGASAKEQPSFLAIGAAEAIANRLPVYESTELKEGVFGGKTPLPDDSVATIAFNHYIVARKGLSDSQVGDFTRYLFTTRQNLKDEVPAIARIEKPDTDKDAAVQAHPGAAAYLDNDQKTFFDRYSDLLYWAMILMGFVGSAVTWLASYARANERLRHMHAIEHLLDVMRSARAAQGLEELERLRIEVDEVLKRTLRQVEHGDLDQAGLAAFSLALDQARLAISDRRAVLTSRGIQEKAETMPGDAAAAALLAPPGAEAKSADITRLHLEPKAAEQG